MDEALSEQLMESTPDLTADRSAHQQEHSLEVQLPFLQVVNPQARIVPIALSDLSVDLVEQMGDGIAATLAELPEESRPLIVASGDMSHQISAAEAKRRDQYALDAMLALNPIEYFESRFRHDIPMCGHATGAVMLHAANKLGAKSAELIHWTHSGVTTGDDHRVVSYAGVVVR
ncbi:AmmeMemoRadiSam system protein B [Planctomycetota bacterium]